MSRPEPLTHAMLEQLEQIWQQQGIPLAAKLQPGLSTDAMRGIMEPLGLQLAPELRTWWGWHDGVPASDVRLARDREMTSVGSQFLPLAEAVQRTRDVRASLEDYDAEVAELNFDPWPPDWIIVTGGSLPVVCDSGRPDEPTSPIHVYDPSSLFDRPSVPRAGSLGQVVRWWLDAFDAGADRFEPETQQWTRRDERLPPAAQRSWLA